LFCGFPVFQFVDDVAEATPLQIFQLRRLNLISKQVGVWFLRLSRCPSLSLP
jgi:hypothetical protein